MKFNFRSLRILPIVTAIVGFIGLTMVSCEDDTSKIGPSISPGQVNITIDSLIFDLHATPFESEIFDSKSGNLLLGNIQVPEYGTLKCSFVTRLMCAASIDVPDSLLLPERVDSCKFMLYVKNGDLTGDSLAPQKISVYMLEKQLPSDINNLFDPTGYYDPTKTLGSKSFIVANLANPDTSYRNKGYVQIPVPLKEEFGKELFVKYRNDPSVFAWPQTLAQFIPGFYVEQTFGSGCVANITQALVMVYFHKKVEKTIIEDSDTIVALVNQRDSVIPLIVSPEVLSSNRVSYQVSDLIKAKISEGETLITTPSGYSTSFRFPYENLVEQYEELDKHLSTISDLILTIPGEPIGNSLGLTVAPNLLLIKTSEIESFFADNKIPDGQTSFTASYNSESGSYQFQSMRSYITDLISKGEVSEEDVDFTILPVDLSYETVSNSYTGAGTTYVTKCVPYTQKPTVTRLYTDKALIVFSFTSQFID